MKFRSWHILIATVLGILALSSCAMNQEGVGANPNEMPDRPGAAH